MNIKGVFQIWMKDGSYHEINLKECHAWTREGCNTCPDFAAEHADISTGGIGKYADWTLTVVRTDLGREVMSRMIEDGTVVAVPATRIRTRSHSCTSCRRRAANAGPRPLSTSPATPTTDPQDFPWQDDTECVVLPGETQLLVLDELELDDELDGLKLKLKLDDELELELKLDAELELDSELALALLLEALRREPQSATMWMSSSGTALGSACSCLSSST